MNGIKTPLCTVSLRRRVRLFVACTALALAFLSPSEARAQFEFLTNADNTLTLRNYTGPGGVVVIPAETNGMAVTAILSAFAGYPNVNSVIVPDSVTVIGDASFYQCWGLTNVTLGTNVTDI